jgi:dipeptidyl aminopeptidase/acylaminoacyl peptidase
MSTKKILPYGTWPSPVSSTTITASAVNLDEIRCHVTGSYWIERRPGENGRCVIVQYISGQTTDALPTPYSARSRANEYGGGAYCVSSDGLFFINDADQNIYFYDLISTPRAITHTNNTCFADLYFDATCHRIICVQQDESDHDREPVNSLVSINTLTGQVSTLCSGYDFYSSPRLSPCGNKLSWLCWNHPDMPWDSTELWVANISSDSKLGDVKQIAGSGTTSIFQPEWSPGGHLTFVSDISGWWNLYQYHDNNIHQLTNEKKEFGLPQWVFSQSTYAFINDHEILCAPINNGTAELSLLDTSTGILTQLDVQWNSFSSLHSFKDCHWFIAASNSSFPELIQFRHKTNEFRHIRSTITSNTDTSFYSYGKTIKFTTRNNDDAFAIYYAPHNSDYAAPDTELPPLIVLTHGGPTAMSDSALDIRKQFWTTRGFAVLDVNYSGSTGFGRAYRERLNNNWGVLDAEDCCDAALHLCKLGLADPDRLIIKGSSAGGYTVLCALTFHDVFSAGASYYGIGDLELLLNDTHKFESRYLDRLIGPFPEAKGTYNQRSPLKHVENLNCPVIFFQGTEDMVVPKEQAEKMFAALRDKGIPVAYVSFEGEQHGFRKAETIKKSIESELCFYTKIFDLPVTDTYELNIENLGDSQPLA